MQQPAKDEEGGKEERGGGKGNEREREKNI